MKNLFAFAFLLFPAMAPAQSASQEKMTDAVITQASGPTLVRKGFENLSEGARIYVQKVFARADLYEGEIDGLYGVGTENAAIAFVDWISERSGGELRFDISTAKGVTDMFAFLRSKGAEDYL